MAKEYILLFDYALYNDETGEAVFNPKYMGELVRCKDGIHACKDGEEEWCERMPWKALDPNWFCADGERR